MVPWEVCRDEDPVRAELAAAAIGGVPHSFMGGASRHEDRGHEVFFLDVKTCLAVAKQVPTWGRHLQRVCGKFEGQVSLVQSLLVNIMGCQFQYEGEALTSRWEGGLVPGFCHFKCEQVARDDRCEHPRCHALQAPRQPGKLCFMELVEGVARALPRRVAVGDPIHTESWGEFIVKDDFSKFWLNDYSTYFADVCGSSWEKAVALYVGGFPNRRGVTGSAGFRFVTSYMCAQCGEDRAAGQSIHSLCREVQFALNTTCPRGEVYCLECFRKLMTRQTACQFYCGGNRCAGRCASMSPPGAEILTGPDYHWALCDPLCDECE